MSSPESILRPWRTVASTYPIDGPFLRLRSDTVELPDGRRIDNYYVRESRGFAVVCALTADGRIVLVRQYKHGAGEVLDELPAGAIDPGESPADCAVRELAEETGYAGDPPVLLRSLLVDPTNASGRFHVFFVANAAQKFAQSLDPTEAIVVLTATLDEFATMVRDGRLSSGSQVAAGYIALDFLAPR